MASWRDVIKVHPAAAIVPMLGEDELVALGEDIKRNGLTTPIAGIVENEKLVLLDGRNRLDAMEKVGIEFKIVRKSRTRHHWRIDVPDLDVDLDPDMRGIHDVEIICTSDPITYIISANIRRRHLSGEQKRELIAQLLKAEPKRSDRQTGRIAGVDNKTVASVRRELEGREEIPHVGKVIDSKGRQQPAKKKAGDEAVVAPQTQHGRPSPPDLLAACVLSVEHEIRTFSSKLDLQCYSDLSARLHRLVDNLLGDNAAHEAPRIDSGPVVPSPEPKQQPSEGPLVWTEKDSREANRKSYNAKLADGSSYDVSVLLDFPSFTFGGYSVSYFDPSLKPSDRNVELGHAITAEKGKRISPAARRREDGG